MSGSEIYAWVQRMSDEFYNSHGRYIYYDCHKNKIRITNIRTGKTAMAKCNNTDKFNREVGIAIAWARYTNKPVPDNM